MHCQAVYSPQATLDLGHRSRHLNTNYIRYSYFNLVLESSSHSAHALLAKSFPDRQLRLETKTLVGNRKKWQIGIMKSSAIH